MEEILPMSTSKAYNKAHIDSLASVFETFHIKGALAREFQTVTRLVSPASEPEKKFGQAQFGQNFYLEDAI